VSFTGTKQGIKVFFFLKKKISSIALKWCWVLLLIACLNFIEERAPYIIYIMNGKLVGFDLVWLGLAWLNN
jgi:hypothetical protein